MAHTRFDWDADKDAENQEKHGVSFSRAQYAFADL
ncbi:MAG: BrnT family toxin [Sulfuricella sp.]|nr:BrnT family toxin [Sulfuricella sp.]